LIIHSHNPTNPEFLAKIGQVDFEITGLTGIVKNKKQQQNIIALRAAAAQLLGRLSNEHIYTA